MSEGEKLSNKQPDSEIETAVEAKPDNKPKSKKASVKGNDPINRFSGDGVVFKAKLFGTADVREPRGDQICATAMNLLKAAVKTTGEHKQRILLKINMTGIVLVDAVSQMKLYEHPVNKISFIAKDPTDNRAFGYIIGEKDGAHMYFGIKTEKAAEQVVITLKDLFQTVFDMKKKEAEMKGKSSPDAETSKSPAATESTPAASSTSQPAPAAESPQQTNAPSNADEPTFGDEPDTAAKPEVKREDSQSHLLDLLDNLSFVEQTTPSTNGQFGQQASANAMWGNSVSQNTAPGWGSNNPAQNDPFAVASASGMFAQQPLFNQPATYPPQQQQPQQPQFQANFNHANSMTSYNQQPFNIPQQTPAASFQTQHNPFNPQASFSPSPNIYSPQQAPVSSSPFVTTGIVQANQPTAFTADPFSSGFQSNSQPQQPPATNPFASSENKSFGVLQPQQVQQQNAQAGMPQTATPGNLFSDLNPLPSTNNSPRKDQFFSDVKNPPKPKLNELQPAQPAQQPQNTNNQDGFPW